MPSARKAFLKALGVKVGDRGVNVSTDDPGMENKLLNRLEGRDLNTQMKEFYTAYSKVSESLGKDRAHVKAGC